MRPDSTDASKPRLMGEGTIEVAWRAASASSPAPPCLELGVARTLPRGPGRLADMSRRLARSVVLLAMILVGVLLCLDVVYFAHGSLEEFPTGEQTGKARVVTAVLAAVLVAAEFGLLLLFRRLKSLSTHRERVAGGTVPPAH